MKHFLLSLLFIVTAYSVNAQQSAHFTTGNHPIGVSIGASLGSATQFKTSIWAYNVYFSASSNFASAQGSVSDNETSGLQDKGKFNATQFNVGGMIRIVNQYLYGLYLVPQVTYCTKSSIYHGENDKTFKGTPEEQYGAAIDVMYVDRGGFTIQGGLSTSAGASLQVGFSF
ncbi:MULTISPECIES: hypothetical protein [Flammeovirga]|uniref:Outer membrane protein beta-barrel domain-containing protein n=1 Tax=Flammeovirga agarivorans TaxID=2726742 RepID=A0A7X8SK98_9BACT|nr:MULTISPECIES: hypothetical protein [Flammeovirga]NLR91794.1 hypothetical protein [Flammeovirga agarivorans]